MFLARRPSPHEIETFVSASRGLPLSYEPIGLAKQERPGFQTDRHEALIGRGTAAFERARRALAEWKHFDLGWVELFPRHAAVEVETDVAILVRHLGFWSMNGCRIVYVIDNDHEFGFAYGTLTNHAESGEEIFKVTYDPGTEDVSYVIRAASRPLAPLARLGYPVARLLQARFRRDSSAALSRAIAG